MAGRDTIMLSISRKVQSFWLENCVLPQESWLHAGNFCGENQKSVNFLNQVEGIGTTMWIFLEILFRVADFLQIPVSKLLEWLLKLGGYRTISAILWLFHVTRLCFRLLAALLNLFPDRCLPFFSTQHSGDILVTLLHQVGIIPFPVFCT